MWLRPRSAGVSPRGSSGRTTTSSPRWKPSTPSPTSATVPGHLVPDHLRRAHPRIHGPVRDVQVGAADAAVRDLQPHLSRSRSAGRGQRRTVNTPWPFVVDGTHRVDKRHNTII